MRHMSSAIIKSYERLPGSCVLFTWLTFTIAIDVFDLRETLRHVLRIFSVHSNVSLFFVSCLRAVTEKIIRFSIFLKYGFFCAIKQNINKIVFSSQRDII